MHSPPYFYEDDTNINESSSLSQRLFITYNIGIIIQIKLSDEKTVIVYNRVNSYILDALLKAVF